MPTQDAPDDDAFRDSYNFAPGYFGLVYRADAPDRGADGARDEQQHKDDGDGKDKTSDSADDVPAEQQTQDHTEHNRAANTEGEQHYKLQAMKWGLVPFWTKRQPDYGTTMRTINCRDDSLAQAGGMWASMKRKKRCIVIAQGFYEWQKLHNGRERIPHYVKRKDGQLMCFAGLWDCVRYDENPKDGDKGTTSEPLYTYTIVTTASNKQLSFLHDRMPVFLDGGSAGMFRWLDRTQTEWTKELQDLLKPYTGELECYPVPREVGKVGNNEARFIAPIDSAANKQNIANFFGKQKASPTTSPSKGPDAKNTKPTGDETNPDEKPATKDAAPTTPTTAGTKRAHPDANPAADKDSSPSPHTHKAAKTELSSPPPKAAPAPAPAPNGRPTRSATKNEPSPSPSKKKATGGAVKAADGSQRITNFFKT